MNEDIDNIIDSNLKLLFKRGNRGLFINELIDSKGSRFRHSDAQDLAKILVRKNLVTVEPVHSERLDLTEDGFEIAKVGWFKYLELLRLKKEEILKQQKIDADKENLKNEQEETIRIETINKFRYDKYSFWLSVGAIAISLLSLLVSILVIL